MTPLSDRVFSSSHFKVPINICPQSLVPLKAATLSLLSVLLLHGELPDEPLVGGVQEDGGVVQWLRLLANRLGYIQVVYFS